MSETRFSSSEAAAGRRWRHPVLQYSGRHYKQSHALAHGSRRASTHTRAHMKHACAKARWGHNTSLPQPGGVRIGIGGVQPPSRRDELCRLRSGTCSCGPASMVSGVMGREGRCRRVSSTALMISTRAARSVSSMSTDAATHMSRGCRTSTRALRATAARRGLRAARSGPPRR